MASVSGRDMRAILSFLEAGYWATAEDSAQRSTPAGTLPRPVLRALDGLIPAKLVESFQIRRDVFDESRYTTNYDEGEPPPGVEEYAHLRGRSPINAFRWRPANGPMRLSGVMSARTLRGLPWYRYYLRPMNIDDQLKIWLWSSSNSAACVSLDRADANFDDRDAAVFAVLQQHLAVMRESLMSGTTKERDPSIDDLTVREAQVLSWAARGRRNEEIAQLLSISPATVRKHLEHAYAKLGVRNRVEAIAAIRGRR